ncbi:MAG TPA: hypothetical protein VGY55_02215 [Pirellulales bacterium]|jgi:hypothetical protein|nr:hypothetical protein [Pirellulales bacterium]
MFRHFGFFKRAIVAANLLWVPSNSHANLSPSLPAPVRAAVQQVARPAARPIARPVSDLPGRDPAPAGEKMNCDCREMPSYTGGLTEAQMRAMD